MNNKTSHKGSFVKRLTAFFGLPLVFVFIAYLLIYLIANPIIAPITSILSMFIGDSVPDFSYGTPVDNDINFVSIGTEQQETLPFESIPLPNVGEVYAHITIPGTSVDCDVYYGDNAAILKRGPGQYEWSKMPGFGSTTLVGAHVNSYFKGLQYVKIGDTIHYTTSYGAYEYKVTDIMIVKTTEVSAAYELRADYNNLVLYTCYPFHSVAFRAQRYFVCAELVSGPLINIYVDETEETN
jgi:sortase A